MKSNRKYNIIYICVIAIVYIVIALLLLTENVQARTHRDPTAVREFRHIHPCPSTGRTTGPCPGYVVDHRVALCVGGADAPFNMRWQSFNQSILKDKWECKIGWEIRLRECELNNCYGMAQ